MNLGELNYLSFGISRNPGWHGIPVGLLRRALHQHDLAPPRMQAGA